MDKPALVAEQLCFALYAASREVTGAYREGLAKHGLTYPQYLTLLSVWEKPGQSVSELGRELSLDSGTLSPLLRRLAADGLVTRERGGADERSVRIFPTKKALALEPAVAQVRCDVEARTGLNPGEMENLRHTLTDLRTRLRASRDWQ